MADAVLVVRGGQFDTDQESQRNRERSARLLLATLTGILVRGCSFLVNIASIGLLYRYFDSVTFGIWLTLTSLWMILIMVADLGVGGGIVNMTARASAENDRSQLAAVYSSGLTMLVAIGTVFGVLVWVLALAVPWQDVLNIPGDGPAGDFKIGLGLMGTALALMVMTGLFGVVKTGQQSAYIANLWSAGAFTLGLLALAIGVYLEAPFSVIAGAFYMAPALVLSAALAIFLFNLPETLRPRWSHVDSHLVRSLLRTGVALFALRLMTGLTNFSDSLLISAMLGPERVQDVAVPARLFNIVTLAVTMFITPLWPVYAHALASGDSQWVRRTFLRSLGLVMVIGVPMSAVFVVAYPWILQAWLGKAYEANVYIVYGLALTCLLDAIGTACAMLLNAGQVFRVQIFMGLAFLVASVALRVIALQVIGTAGVPLATAIAYFCAMIVPLAFVVRSFLKKSRLASTK